MLLSEDAPTQLVRLATSLPTVCEGLTNYAAGCGVRVGVGIGIVGSLVDVLGLSSVNIIHQEASAPNDTGSNSPFPRREAAPGRQTWTRQCRRRWLGVAEPLRLKYQRVGGEPLYATLRAQDALQMRQFPALRIAGGNCR